MPLTPGNIQNDYLVLDNTEAITYFRRTATQPATFDSGTAVNNALRRAREKDDTTTTSMAQLVRVHLVWHIPAVQVGTPNPKSNDVIQDAGGTRWSVLKVEVDDFITRFRCTTIQERLSGG